MGSWVMGAVLGIVGLLGLLLASGREEGALYYLCLLVFAGCVLGIYGLIIKATGQPPRKDDLDPAQP